MLLTIDVGNTSTALAVFAGDKIVAVSHRPTPKRASAQFLKGMVKASIRSCIHDAIVSSVVPGLDRSLRQAIKKVTGVQPIFINHRSPTGLKIKIDQPPQLGADRIADAAGAVSLRKPPLIVIDSGTAVTFDLISRKYEYLGGCILPGVGISLKSLAENTAKLKLIRFAQPQTPIGTNTVDSIRAGIFYGHIGAIEGLISSYKKILGPGTRVMATGGLIRHFQGKIRGIDSFEPNLIFLGLKAIHEKLRMSPRPRGKNRK